MDAATRVAIYFEDLVDRCNREAGGRPVGFAAHDQTIFYVISARCEMDMSGLESVFDQLLEEREVQILIAALTELGSPELADAFKMAHERLKVRGFYDDEEIMVCDLASEDGGLLDDIAELIRKDNALWELDESLVKLLPQDAV